MNLAISVAIAWMGPPAPRRSTRTPVRRRCRRSACKPSPLRPAAVERPRCAHLQDPDRSGADPGHVRRFGGLHRRVREQEFHHGRDAVERRATACHRDRSDSGLEDGRLVAPRSQAAAGTQDAEEAGPAASPRPGGRPPCTSCLRTHQSSARRTASGRNDERTERIVRLTSHGGGHVGAEGSPRVQSSEPASSTCAAMAISPRPRITHRVHDRSSIPGDPSGPR
jgi:hypothetical protein